VRPDHKPRFVPWLGAFPQERQGLWFPKHVLQDSSAWSSPPLVFLRDIHNVLLTKYDFKEDSPPLSLNLVTGLVLGAARKTGIHSSRKPALHRGFTTEAGQLNRLHEDASTMPPMPSQHRVTQQIIQHWQPFQDLKQTFAVSRRAEQLRLRTQQDIIATAEDSVLRTEMANLESQEEDAPRRVLWFKPMAWLGQIRPHRRDDA
jgi:hypothetical protein